VNRCKDLTHELACARESQEDMKNAAKGIVLTTEVNGQKYIEKFDATGGFVLFMDSPDDKQVFRCSCSPGFLANAAVNLMNALKSESPQLFVMALLGLADGEH
jgi:hypothetical protein